MYPDRHPHPSSSVLPVQSLHLVSLISTVIEAGDPVEGVLNVRWPMSPADLALYSGDNPAAYITIYMPPQQSLSLGLSQSTSQVFSESLDPYTFIGVSGPWSSFSS